MLNKSQALGLRRLRYGASTACVFIWLCLDHPFAIGAPVLVWLIGPTILGDQPLVSPPPEEFWYEAQQPLSARELPPVITSKWIKAPRD